MALCGSPCNVHPLKKVRCAEQFFFSLPLVGFKGNLSLLQIFCIFSRGLKQLEEKVPSSMARVTGQESYA